MATISVSSVSAGSKAAKQNHKKKVQILMKKTHFSETEINRLLEIHYSIMVSFFSLDQHFHVRYRLPTPTIVSHKSSF